MKRSKVRDLLERKGYRVVSIGPRETVGAAVRRMAEERVGSLVVFGIGGVSGIVTWHDVLQAISERASDLDTAVVEEIMSSPVVTVEPSADLGEIAALMVKCGIRHVPVVDGRTVIGVVSRIDALTAHLKVVDDFSDELCRYIAGRP